MKTHPTLLSKIRRGDEDGWCVFYEFYQGFIYAAARDSGLSHEESQDIVQETMITVQNYINEFVPDAGRAKFRTWLRTIVHSRIADAYRKKKRNPVEQATLGNQPLADDPATSTTNRIPDLNEVELDRLVDGKLEEAIVAEARRLAKEQVPLEHYQVYDLFAVQDLSAKDVASTLGISTVTVRVRAFRVRRIVAREVRRIANMLEQPKAGWSALNSPGETAPIASKAPEAPSEPGYNYVKQISRGGYGYVYLFARNFNAQRDYVAGKFFYRHLFGPPQDAMSMAAYERALEGLRNFRSLSPESPYLLRIVELRERHQEGYFCYMMELADDLESGRRIEPGVYRPRTLKNELVRSGARRRLPARRCVELGIMLARGLQLLHDRGFIHRDVRPSNIIFVNEVPKLADIDLVADHHSTLTSYIPRNYAAPEGAHSTRADIFSFGKTMYEMCTGLPVQAFPSLPPDLHFWDDHPLVLQLNKIIGKACARDFNHRYESAQNLLNDLERLW